MRGMGALLTTLPEVATPASRPGAESGAVRRQPERGVAPLSLVEQVIWMERSGATGAFSPWCAEASVVAPLAARDAWGKGWRPASIAAVSFCRNPVALVEERERCSNAWAGVESRDAGHHDPDSGALACCARQIWPSLLHPNCFWLVESGSDSDADAQAGGIASGWWNKA